MRERGSGAIVHVSARPGIEPTAGMAAYSVSKPLLPTSPAFSTSNCARMGSG